jgi:chemotaxis protein MotB
VSRRERIGRPSRSNELASKDRWLVSYADFVTLLFALFVVLFALSYRHTGIGAMSSVIRGGFESLKAGPSQRAAKVLPETHPVPKAAAPTAPAPLAQYDSTKLTTELNGVFGDSIAKREIVMQPTNDGLVISLRELGFFDSGDARLLPAAAEKLRSAASVLIAHGLEVRVEGHSDDQPIHNALFQSNWELSTARAMSVLTMLVEEANFPPNRISVAGYGAFRPVASNDTPEGRRMNRRVDLVVIAPPAAH